MSIALLSGKHYRSCGKFVHDFIHNNTKKSTDYGLALAEEILDYFDLDTKGFSETDKKTKASILAIDQFLALAEMNEEAFNDKYGEDAKIDHSGHEANNLTIYEWISACRSIAYQIEEHHLDMNYDKQFSLAFLQWIQMSLNYLLTTSTKAYEADSQAGWMIE